MFKMFIDAIPPEQWGMLLAISFLGILGVLATETEGS